jgi:hypothetical protein
MTAAKTGGQDRPIFSFRVFFLMVDDGECRGSGHDKGV